MSVSRTRRTGPARLAPRLLSLYTNLTRNLVRRRKARKRPSPIGQAADTPRSGLDGTVNAGLGDAGGSRLCRRHARADAHMAGARLRRGGWTKACRDALETLRVVAQAAEALWSRPNGRWPSKRPTRANRLRSPRDRIRRIAPRLRRRRRARRPERARRRPRVRASCCGGTRRSGRRWSWRTPSG